MLVRRVITAALLLLFIAIAAPWSAAWAQEGEPVKRFIELMDDPAVRAFLQQASNASQGDPLRTAASEVDQVASGAGSALAQRFERWKAGANRLPVEMDVIGDRLSTSIGGFGSGKLIGFIVMFTLAGYLAERLFWRVSRGVRNRIVNTPRVTRGDHVMFFFARVVVTLMSMGMVALGSIGAFYAVGWPEAVETVLKAYLWVALTAGFSAMVARFVVTPWFKPIRMVPMGRKPAFVVYRSAIALPAVGVFGYLSAGWMEKLGVSADGALLVRDGTTALLALLFVAFVWRWRQVSGADPETETRRSVPAEFERWLWTVAALGTAALIYAGMPALAMTVFIVAMLGPVIRIARSILRAAVDARTGNAEDAEKVPASDLAALIERIVRALIVIGAIALVINAWGLSPARIVGEDTSEARALRAAVQVLIALLIADFVWHAARRWIDRRIADAADEPDETARRTRLATLLPLFRKALGIVLLVAVGLIALSALGVEIAPLLGAAGIVGIAVGFGAQALVRDIVSGIFFLIDDAFRVGEYVEVGSIRGTVEAITIRSLRLRHHRGPLHTLPFGEIRSLTNHSRDWVIVKIEFPFGLDVDPQKVKKVVKQVSAAIAEDPDLKKDLLEPPKSQGIRRLEDYSAVIGVKFMSRPGEQFVLRREIYHRLLKAFDAAGLKLSSRDVVVHSGGGMPSPAELGAAAGAAAMRAKAEEE